MKLTQELAEKHIGQYIDSYRRKPVSGYYPKQIVKLQKMEGIYLKDPTGTCTKIFDESNGYQDFDYFIKGEIEETEKSAC